MFVPPRGEGDVPNAPGHDAGTPPPPGSTAPPGSRAGTVTAATAVAVGRATVPTSGVDADVVAAATARLSAPALIVITGLPGAGRSTALRRIASAFHGPVFTGGALAMLRSTPGLALARAVRARLPVHDPALLAEAVRSRVRHGLLLLDDVQWADPLTIAALPEIARHCRIAVTLRTPHRLPGDAEPRLRAAAAAWLPVPPLPPAAAAALARQAAPHATAATVADVVRRAGGVPLAVTALARHAAAHQHTEPATGDLPAAQPPPPPAGDPAEALTYAVAAALADLSRPARTAIAALGLLGRPAPAAMLGSGVDELSAAGLVDLDDDTVSPTSPYLAEVATGLLDPAARQALHRRLARHVPAGEAARHLAAAGAADEAYRAALAATQATTSTGERAELLLFACALPGVAAEPAVRLAAARAALAAGRPTACLRVLDPDPADVATAQLATAHLAGAAVLRGEALLQTGAATAAVQAVTAVTDTVDPETLGARDRIRLLGHLAADPAAATAALSTILATHGDPPRHHGLRAAVAAVRAHQRTPGWEQDLAVAAAAAGAGGDPLAARWSAWLLVETLAADGRLTQASQASAAAATACAADLAYSWQTRFLAAELWCTALRGDHIDDVVRRAGDLADRTLPTLARGYAVAATSLAEADGGLLAAARGRLTRLGNQPASAAAALDWVAREAAWLDGQPDLAGHPDDQDLPAPPLVDGLRRITARWAAYDSGTHPGPTADPHATTGEPPPVHHTLAAWAAANDPGHFDPGQFDTAAAAWHGTARREEIRCLLAHGLLENEPARAVPPLLQAERLAEEAGLVVLLGRARRALRRHSVRRDIRGRRAGDDLTDRERDVLRLVANGEPTRRIAGQLGISRETVETHIRSGMRKLGARTRTEAAALAMETLA
jgi:DNA-binding CsgD family transcriptional regulator